MSVCASALALVDTARNSALLQSPTATQSASSAQLRCAATNALSSLRWRPHASSKLLSGFGSSSAPSTAASSGSGTAPSGLGGGVEESSEASGASPSGFDCLGRSPQAKVR